MIVAGVLLLAPNIVHRQRFVVPDEKAAGVALLAEKLDGPGYFHASSPKEAGPFDEGGPWISVEEAEMQVPRVVTERHLSPEKAATIKELISQLAEPHPSRTIGGERVALVRLNLALDASP
jgi:K+-transporting ATPase c subunit